MAAENPISSESGLTIWRRVDCPMRLRQILTEMSAQIRLTCVLLYITSVLKCPVTMFLRKNIVLFNGYVFGWQCCSNRKYVICSYVVWVHF